MCENKCCYVQTGDCKDNCCSGVMTSNTECEYWIAPNIQGEPTIVSSEYNFDPTLAYGHNTKVLLNGKPLPYVLSFSCSEGHGEFTCILGEYILKEEIEAGSELKIFVTIGEKEVVLFEEKIYVFDKVYSCDTNPNLIKVTIMFSKFEVFEKQ